MITYIQFNYKLTLAGRECYEELLENRTKQQEKKPKGRKNMRFKAYCRRTIILQIGLT